MAFPDSPLPLVGQVALGADLTADPRSWAMTDCTTYLYTRDNLTIARGRPDEASTAETSECDVTANNRDGRWSTRNANSTWYGQLRKGTPFRIGVQRVVDTFTRSVSNGWGAPDVGGAWSIVGGASSLYAVNGTQGTITIETTVAVRSTIADLGSANQAFTLDGLLNVAPTGAAINMGAYVRFTDSSNYYWVRMQVGTDSLISLILSKRVAGSLSTVTTVATGLTNSTTIPQRLRVQIRGNRIKAKTWRSDGTEPATWAINTTDSSLTTGTFGGCIARRESGNTNTNPVVAFDTFNYTAWRFAGFLAELPPRWDLSGKDRYAPLKAKGLLYRLAQGASPERSAMKRTILGADPVEYWPLEDLSSSTQAASAVGGPRMQATNVTFGTYAGPAGSDMTPDLFTNHGILKGVVSGGSATSWCVGFALATPYITDVVARIYAQTATAHYLWRIAMPPTSSDNINVFIEAPDGTITTTLVGTAPTNFADIWHHYGFSAEQSGGNVTCRLYVDGVLAATTTTAGTLGPVSAVWINHNAAQIDSAAHVEVTNATVPAGAAALAAYVGEQAHTRVLRLGTEEGVSVTCDASESQALGPQGIKSLPDLLRECEASDQGYLYEDTEWGLVFQSHTERENQTALLALDYTTDAIVAFEPTDDDQQAHNDVEVRRDGGSSSRQVEESATAELSTVNIGRRDDSQTYSLYTDDQTYHLAGWRLHVATYPGYRFPGLHLNLAAGPDLIDDVCNADLAYRTTVAHPPDDIRDGGDPSVIVEGYTETLGPYEWDLVNNCSLQGPWEVSVLAATSGDTDPHLGWLEFDTLTLHTTVNTTATSWSVDASPVDTTTADDFPRDMLIDGELITVTACSGGSAPQTWTVTRSVNGIVKAHSAGARITVAHPFTLAL